MQKEQNLALVALYANLAQAEAAYSALLGLGVAEAQMHLGAHSRQDFGDAAVPLGRTDLAWSLTARPSDQMAERIADELRRHKPLLLNRFEDDSSEYREVDQGARAWRHYVFESPVATDYVTDRAGTTGTTGITNSGAFARGANAEGQTPGEASPSEE